MPTRQNPCAVAAVNTAKWYQKLNGTTKLIVIATAIVLATIGVEARYAKSSDVQPINQKVSALVAAMTIQQVTRQTVLELKVADGSITAEERVELTGIVKVLDALK
jgi:hypothetical protein